MVINSWRQQIKKSVYGSMLILPLFLTNFQKMWLFLSGCGYFLTQEILIEEKPVFFSQKPGCLRMCNSVEKFHNTNIHNTI